MIIRRAKKTDRVQYFHWVNDELVRQNAFNSELIDWETHINWFESKLNDENSFLYLVKIKSNAIGQVRFECEYGKAIISYSIDSDFRGKKLAKKMVKESLLHFLDDCQNIECIEARIKIENIVSSKVFQRLHFTEQRKTKELVVYQLPLCQVKMVLS